MEAHDQNDEPQTPMWLPAVGIVLFLVAGIWWATRPIPRAAPEPPAPASATPSASIAPAVQGTPRAPAMR